MTAAALQAINARAILATLDRRYDLGDDGDASPCNSAVPYVLEVILVCVVNSDVFSSVSSMLVSYRPLALSTRFFWLAKRRPALNRSWFIDVASMLIAARLLAPIN